MNIGIITFVKCNNYGAELQAYALQKKLNDLGHNAEIIDVEKDMGALYRRPSTYRTAIINRYKYFGLLKGTLKVVQLIYDKYCAKKSIAMDADLICRKRKKFHDFFYLETRHSDHHYTLDEIRSAESLPYDVLIAGSDQIWNYQQTDYLDVYFLMMAKDWNIKRMSYAASFGVKKIPNDKKNMYKMYLENLDAISVREIDGLDIVRSCSKCEVSMVLDPTLLLNKSVWVRNLVKDDFLPKEKKYVVIYTLSGSRYIYDLAKRIAAQLNVEVLNIKGGFKKAEDVNGVQHVCDAGPGDFISIYNHAAYIITDSFHGTAFALNFNVPFTTLLNPVSSINSRALSILKLTKMEDRLIYDDGTNSFPDKLDVDFSVANREIERLRKESLCFLQSNLTK